MSDFDVPQHDFSLRKPSDMLRPENTPLLLRPKIDVTNANFASPHTYEKETQPGHALSLDWIEMEVDIDGPAVGTQLLLANDCAFARNAAACAFDKLEVMMADVVISDINSDVAEADTMVKRAMMPGEMLKGYQGDLNFMQPSFEERQAHTARNGVLLTRAGASNPRILGSLLNPVIPIAQTWAYTDATRLVTFNGPATAALNFQPGDVVLVQGTTGVGGLAVVESTTNLLTFVLSSPLGANIAAAAISGAHSITRYRGNRARQTHRVILQFKPSLGAFMIEALPAGKMTAEFTGRASFQTAMVQSLNASLDSGAGNDFNVTIRDMRLAVSDFLVDRLPNGDHSMVIPEVDVTRRPIVQADEEIHLTVKPSTFASIFGVQDARVRQDTRASFSELKAFDNTFAVRQDLNVTEWFLEYGHLKYPRNSRTHQFVRALGTGPIAGVDTIIRQYGQSLSAAHAVHGSGPEAFEDYLNSGWFNYVNLDKEADNRERNMTINLRFSSAPLNCTLVNASIYSKKVVLSIEGGSVRSARVES